jgi:hypothetical protein
VQRLSLLLIDLVGGVDGGDSLRERDSLLLLRRKCVLPDENDDDIDSIVLGWRGDPHRCDDGSTTNAAASTDGIAI